MKTLKLLNRNFFLLINLVLVSFNSYAEDKPVDIWNIEKETKLENSANVSDSTQNITTSEDISNPSIFDIQSKKETSLIKLEDNIDKEKIKIVGLYDPEDYGLDISMWSNSNGDQLKSILSRLNKMNLSQDAREIMNMLLLINAYNPTKNISEKEFMKFKSDWLIKDSNFELIEKYITQNQAINIHPNLTKYLVNSYLSESNIEKSCEIFSKNEEPINDEYLSKFNIYCLIVRNKNEEAQIILDLKKELGFKDEYFEKKISYLFGFNDKIDKEISEKSILDFHLAHITNPEFTFEPNDKTNKIIWKYLSSSNLLTSLKEIDSSEIEKIVVLEKAVNDKNYSEKDLLELYKRFQFNINQLLNAQNTYKSLSNIESRALIYQKILLESEPVERLKLLKILKELFLKDNLKNAFDVELKKFLKEIDPTKIPANLTSFYYTNIEIEKNLQKKIKFNNDVMHQSKLINYFNGDYSKSKIEKDVDNFLKKIKKNKKYFLSKKDIIFIESLKYDGVEISKKYDDLYVIDENEIPTDIQVMINNDEKGMALLRIAEVIGQDNLERIDEDTIYFIIYTLNKLNIDPVRNKILLKVLPLKV